MEAFDRFLDLPEGVLHHIISFMPAKEIARLSTMSVTCLQLCLTNPSLTFNSQQDFQPIVTTLRRYHLYNYLHHSLTYRNIHNISLLRFRILWWCLPIHALPLDKKCYVIDERRFLEVWIAKVFKLHVQHLHLDLQWAPGDLKPFPLPLSSSLKSLDFTLNGGVLELPFHDPPLVFNFLESLTVKDAQIATTDHGNIGEFFSQSCRRVKKLFFCHLRAFTNLSITSERLERLEFRTCCCESDPVNHPLDTLRQINISTPNLKALLLTWHILSPDNRSTNIYAPNIELLEWNCFSQHWNVGPFNSLRNVNINLLPIPFSPVAFDLSRLFRCIQSVKILTVHSLIMETVLAQGRCDESFKLDNVEELNIVLSGLCKDVLLVPAVAAFLGRTPNLKVLRISYYSGDKTPGINMSLETLRIQMPRHSFPQGIKELHLKLQGGENEGALIAYLAENAHRIEESSSGGQWKQVISNSRLEGKYPSKAAMRIAQLALNCLEAEPKNRPPMKEVVVTLEGIESSNEKQIEPRIRSNRPRPNQRVPQTLQQRSPLHTRQDGNRVNQHPPQLR